MTRIGTPLSPTATRVLLCGCGELGKEVVIELQRLGVEVIAVDRYANAPAMQVAHAAQLAWESEEMPEAVREAWAADGYRVRVVLPSRESWESTPRPVSIIDAGFTELDGPTETTRAFW